MSGKREAKPSSVRATADTKVGSQRVRLLPDSAEREAAAFDSPQATELLDPAELPDAMRNLGIGIPRGAPRDADATVTFDPAELLRDDPLPPHDRTLIADHLTDSEPSSLASREAGFLPPSEEDVAPATDILQLDRTLESGGVSLDVSFTAAPMTLPEEEPLGGIGALPSLPSPEANEQPSWLGNAKPVDLGRPQSASASPFEDEKRALPTGAFGPIDPAAADPTPTAAKGKGCSVIFALVGLALLVSGGLSAAFALGAFDGDGGAAVTTADNAPETSTASATDTPASEDAPKSDPAPEAETDNKAAAVFNLPPATGTPGETPPGTVGTPPTEPAPNATENTAPAPPATAATPAGTAKPVPIGFVRVLDNTKSKLPELAETLQQSVLRQLSTNGTVDARPGPVRIGLLVELRLQVLKIPDAKPETEKTFKAEADCSLVVRPTPLGSDEAESRNAHAAIDSTLPLGTRLERGAVASVAISACGEALAADLIAFASEHTIDWSKAEAAAQKDDEKLAAAEAKKKKKTRRTKRRKRRRKRR